MENKKQLVIIPPMSEAVKKLHEVLEGISADENVEISIIDDLKELNQFLGSTGQCLVLVSNAKKCATFLQDNKMLLAKHHCKTILFTPKEIPAKTLVKFTKVGLTESILESSPPKTFLYKVKLLLRSIKTQKAQDDAEKVVKSLEAAKMLEDQDQDKEVKEKMAIEENVIDLERPDKKKNDSEENTIDYSNPLKGKIKPQDENLDSHWKSDLKKDSVNPEEMLDEPMTATGEQSNIDMYYRNKRKQDIDLKLGPADTKTSKMNFSEEEESEKKKSMYADVIEEGSMKEKRLDQKAYEEEERERKETIELDLLPGKAKKKNSNADSEEVIPLFKRGNSPIPENTEDNTSDGFTEDLGGYLKGKVSESIELLPGGDNKAPGKKYDNSEVEEHESKDFDLQLDPGKAKKKNGQDQDEIEDNIHDGVVDHLEGDMIGDAGTVEKIRTRMNGSSEYTPEEEDLENGSDLFAKKRKLDQEAEDFRDKSLDLEESEEEKKEAKKKDERLPADEEAKKDKLVDLDLIAAKKKSSDHKDDSLDEGFMRTKSLAEDKLEDSREKEATAKAEEEKEKRSREASGQLEKTKEHTTHDGTVDKIDTFYRSNDSVKKKDQDWGNLGDKKSSLDIIPGKGKRTDETIAAEKNDLGEVTIDYRKLKEEFDMISREGSSIEPGAISKTRDGKLQNDDDDGSFKVVEINPLSLDFSINIINSIYQKDLKAKQIFAILAEELISTYHCLPIFYSYKLSDKKFSEAFNPFVDIKKDLISNEKKEWWNEYKKETALFEHYQSKSMTTWRCPEIVNNNEVWEDVELPTWAEQELKTKHVELIFPYFDGIDRMGLAVVFLPDGLDPKTANGLLTVLEMARTLFLDTIERYKVQPIKEVPVERKSEDAPVEEKKNVLSFFGGLFGKKKAG